MLTRTVAADILPDPSVGSGSPASDVSNLLPTQEFDKINQEAENQPNGPQNLKQSVDYVLHDLKPSKRPQ